MDAMKAAQIKINFIVKENKENMTSEDWGSLSADLHKTLDGILAEIQNPTTEQTDQSSLNHDSLGNGDGALELNQG